VKAYIYVSSKVKTGSWGTYNGWIEEIYLPWLDKCIVSNFIGTHILLVNLRLRFHVCLASEFSQSASSTEENIRRGGLGQSEEHEYTDWTGKP
jgi:hypothetical protein